MFSHIALDASPNATSAVLLAGGYPAIPNGRVARRFRAAYSARDRRLSPCLPRLSVTTAR
jgi:hypothetical protein